jgi:hypothetical protein
MLPSYKTVIGVVLLSAVLFVMTGAGVVMPETYTRIGEMPEISRPMMQGMITDGAGQARFHVLNLTRRAEEIDKLRMLAALEVDSPPADVVPVLTTMKVSAEPTTSSTIAPGATPPTSLAAKPVAPETSAIASRVSAPERTDNEAATTPDVIAESETVGTPRPEARITASSADSEATAKIAALPPSDDENSPEAVPIGEVRLPRERPPGDAEPTVRSESVARAAPVVKPATAPRFARVTPVQRRVVVHRPRGRAPSQSADYGYAQQSYGSYQSNYSQSGYSYPSGR